jgi:uncharacterized protein
MQIDVSKLLQSDVGTTSSLRLSEKIEDLDKEIKVVSPALGEVELLRTDEGILVKGNFSTTLELTCSRCLEKFKKKSRIEFEQEYIPFWKRSDDKIKEGKRQEGFVIDEKNKISLTEVVRQEFLVNLPMKLICRPDCEGLCGQCGQNLNIKKCKCKKVKSTSERQLKDFIK